MAKKHAPKVRSKKHYLRAQIDKPHMGKITIDLSFDQTKEEIRKAVVQEFLNALHYVNSIK